MAVGATFEHFHEIAVRRDYDRTSISGFVEDFLAACTWQSQCSDLHGCDGVMPVGPIRAFRRALGVSPEFRAATTAGVEREEMPDPCRPQILGNAVEPCALNPARLAQVELAQQLPDADAVMARDALRDARPRLRADWIVQRHHLVMLAALLGRDADMRAAPSHPLVSCPARRRHECNAAQVTREPQAARTSSLT